MKKFLLPLIALLPSCSVVMASNRGGTDIDSLQSISTRTELIALGADPINREKTEEGQLIETYKIEKERGSIARAFLHGFLDLSTAFLWELAGTPIEYSLDQPKFYSVKVTFNEDERIQRIELF